MTALVAIESVAIALLALLVVALLRSHGDVLRRLAALETGAPRTPGAERAPARAAGEPAPDIVGTTVEGDPVQVAVGGGGGTLLAFLTSGCGVCDELWRELRRHGPPPIVGARLVVVAKDARAESLSRLRALAPDDVTVVLSGAAWEHYRVPGSPYVVHVDGTGAVAGEGSAETWGAIASLLADATGDLAAHAASATREAQPGRGDAELAAAGIERGHPSLYGGRNGGR